MGSIHLLPPFSPIHYCNLERFSGCHLGWCPGHVGPGCIFVTLTALQCDTVKEIIQFHCFLTSIFIYFLSFDRLAADQIVLLKVDCILILKLTIRLWSARMWSLNSENSSSSLSPAASLFSKIIFKVLRTETFFPILTVMHRQSYLFGVPHLLICWVWENIEWFSQDSQYKTRQHSFMQFKICCVISQQIGQGQEVTGWNNTKLNCVPEHHKSLTDDMFKHISIYRLLSDVTVKCLK